jgi:hypothetical protein
MGKKCGRRERESRREGAYQRESNLSADVPERVVAVEGIPVFRKAALFAGRCRNEGLGRLVIGCRGFLRGDRARR